MRYISVLPTPRPLLKDHGLSLAGCKLLTSHGLPSPECFSGTKIHILVNLSKAAAQFGG